MYIKIVETAIHPEKIIEQAKTLDSGCVVTYVGLIRDNSHNKKVLSVEYRDTATTAEASLKKLGEEIKSKFAVNDLALCHRVGTLNVGEVNIVFAFACGHRQEGFAACAYAVDRFKEQMPTQKKETYVDGSTRNEW
jgi:molybdopterin synthase catalytic subunit